MVKVDSIRIRITPEMKEYLDNLYNKYKTDEEINTLSDVIRMIINMFRESPYGKI